MTEKAKDALGFLDKERQKIGLSLLEVIDEKKPKGMTARDVIEILHAVQLELLDDELEG